LPIFTVQLVPSRSYEGKEIGAGDTVCRWILLIALSMLVLDARFVRRCLVSVRAAIR
jgi:hypothetical protein